MRVGTENSGQRSQRFLYHRRRLKKVKQPNQRLVDFWKTFPNSDDPISVLKEALKNKVFDSDDQSNQTNDNQENENQRGQEAPASENPVATDEDRNDTRSQEHQRDHQMNLRKRKVPNYQNLRKQDWATQSDLYHSLPSQELGEDTSTQYDNLWKGDRMSGWELRER